MALKVSTALLDLPRKPHVLYRFFDRTDTLLYVGITANMGKRLGQHRTGKPWWSVVEYVKLEHFASRKDVLKAEKEAIETEGPLYNDQHNELVEAPMIHDGEHEDEARDLAVSVLGSLEEDERDAVLQDNRFGFDGEELTERDRYIAAAQCSVVTVFWERKILTDALMAIFRHLPDDQRRRCLDAGEEATATASIQSRSRTAHAVAQALHAELAAEYLNTLPVPEYLEWLACARTALPKAGAAELIRYAADYAKSWRASRYIPRRLCIGAGKHGARCPGPVEFTVWQEGCADCEGNAAPGHPCCRKHHDRAIRGEIKEAGGVPVVISRSSVGAPELWPF